MSSQQQPQQLQLQSQQQQQQQQLEGCSCDVYHCSTVGGKCCCTHPYCVCKTSSLTGQVELLQQNVLLPPLPPTTSSSSAAAAICGSTQKQQQQQQNTNTTPTSIPIPKAAATTSTVDIAVGGMTCSMCSSAIEKALMEFEYDGGNSSNNSNNNTNKNGIVSCTVSLATNLATVVYYDQVIPDPKIIANEIEDIGYDVTDIIMRKNTATNGKKTPQQQAQQQQQQQQSREVVVELTVGGMTCSMCSSAVEKAVSSMDGVVSCHVSLATNVARVVYYDDNSRERSEGLNNSRSEKGGSGSSRSSNDILISPEMIQEMIEDIGYDVTDVMVVATHGDVENHDDVYYGDGRGTATTETVTPDGYGYSDGVDNYNVDVNNDDDRLGRILRQQDKQLQIRRRNFLWSLMFVIPIMTITMVIPRILPSTNCVRQFLDKDIVIHTTASGGGDGHDDHTLLVEAVVVWLLTTPIQFVCGYSFYKTSYHGIMRGVLGMDVLVCIGTTSSYVYAFIAMIMNDPGYRFFETSAVLICFVLLGKWMNAMAVRRTSEALTHLMSLQPKTCLKVTPIMSAESDKSQHQHQHQQERNKNMSLPYNHELDLWNPLKDSYTEQVVPIHAIHPGDIVKVLKGAAIPADGVVLHGEMTVDQSMITGESIPVLREPGDDVLGGTICSETGTSTLTSSSTLTSAVKASNKTSNNPLAAATFVRVTGVGAESALAQIVQLVQEAQTRQVPIQSMADSIASVFVPVVVVFSFLTFVAWYGCCRWGIVPEHWYGEESPATFSLLFGIAALVISCPCALGLATPTAVMVGTGVGANHGILMKGGETLESASKVDAVIFDKTGTLTRGKPAVTDITMVVPNEYIRKIMSSNDVSVSVEDYLLWLLASLERNSEHVLATAIVKYAEATIGPLLQSKGFAQATDFQALTGRGAHAVVNGNATVAVGNRVFADRELLTVSKNVEDMMQRMELEGKTAVVAGINGTICAVLGIADQVKDESAATVQYLRDMGIDCWMVTGDSQRTAFSIAKKLNIPPDRVIAEALPSSKVDQVKSLKAEGLKVAMVGDGVNDSPALAEADVGISMGTGAEIAAEASDMVLVSGNISGVVTALDLSRVIFNRIRWNFGFSMIYNILGIPLAAGVFFPILHTRLPPTVAAIAMALSSVSVVFSSLALRLYTPPDVNTMNGGRQSLAARARENLPRILRVSRGHSSDRPEYEVVNSQGWEGDFDGEMDEDRFQDEIV